MICELATPRQRPINASSDIVIEMPCEGGGRSEATGAAGARKGGESIGQKAARCQKGCPGKSGPGKAAGATEG